MGTVVLYCTISTIKKYNAYLHYLKDKDDKFYLLGDEQRKVAIQKLKDKKQIRWSHFDHLSILITLINEASYKVPHILSKKAKPYSDAEIVRECIIEVLGCIDSNLVDKYKTIHLSRKTNSARHHGLALHLSVQLHGTFLEKPNIY